MLFFVGVDVIGWDRWEEKMLNYFMISVKVMWYINCYEIIIINMYFCMLDGELKFCNNRLIVKLIYMYILLFMGEFVLKKFM